MAKVPFSQYEAVVLLDGYINSITLCQSRLDAVKKVSDDLRKMAINNGVEVDDIYRNVNGIYFQMSSMESAYAGRTIKKPATKLFTKIVEMYRENRTEYDKILEEAKLMIDNENIAQMFMKWFLKNAPQEHMVTLYSCYSEIDLFCKKNNILQKSIFQTTDLHKLIKVYRCLSNISKKKNIDKYVIAIQYYIKFIKINNLKKSEISSCDSSNLNDCNNTCNNHIISPETPSVNNSNTINYYSHHTDTVDAVKSCVVVNYEDDLSTKQYSGSIHVKDCSPRETDYFQRVLEKYFVKGFRLGSSIDMKKFKRYYEELNGISISKDKSFIEQNIKRCGIIHENKVFLPKTMLSDDVKAKLFTYIENTFNSGKNSIYFEALFKRFSDEFLDCYMYNSDMLRSYLTFEYDDKYNISKNQISKDGCIATNPIDEVRACLKEHGSPMENSELYAILSHLPQQTIEVLLGANLEFVRNSKGEYFHADMLSLTNEELENIAMLINASIRSHRYISGTELMNAIRAKYPYTYEIYSCYSDIGWRDALKYKFGDRFSFRGNIISSPGSTLSMNDVFAQIASEADKITIDELLAFAEDMGSSIIYFDAVYQNALRINEDTFVSRKRAAFQVKETDKILDRFCVGNYIPLSFVNEFGIFPDAGFPWNVYLLECYVAFYSERYSLVHGMYNRNCAVGAIVKKNAGYTNFDDLIVDVIADSDILLRKKEVLDFLVRSGYIARRSYANINELIIRANAQRNSKGRK